MSISFRWPRHPIKPPRHILLFKHSQHPLLPLRFFALPLARDQVPAHEHHGLVLLSLLPTPSSLSVHLRPSSNRLRGLNYQCCNSRHHKGVRVSHLSQHLDAASHLSIALQAAARAAQHTADRAALVHSTAAQAIQHLPALNTRPFRLPANMASAQHVHMERLTPCLP